MTRKAHQAPRIGLALTTALASLALAGCATTGAPQADSLAAKAQGALAKGQYDKAIAHAEAAVLAEPRNSSLRAMLGAAYMEAGRFHSAATSFQDALELGDEDPRTVLSLALARIALGDNAGALQLLGEWEGAIDPADLGLALSLAGAPDRGVHVLANALRQGQSTPKLRQNLAYSYALQGNWRAAKIMAAEDVPANLLDDRIAEWAMMAQPDDYQKRVAALLDVAPAADGGQPAHLALERFPSTGQLAAEAAARMAPEPAELASSAVDAAPWSAKGELPPVSAPVSAPASAPVSAPLSLAPASRARANGEFAAAFAAPASKAETVQGVEPGAEDAAPAPRSIRYVSRPVIQPLPAAAGGARLANREASSLAPVSSAAGKPASPQARPASEASASGGKAFGARTSRQGRMSIAASDEGSHLVQLGSFLTRERAEMAWPILLREHPELKGAEPVITKARVGDRIYYRVAAAAFDAGEAKALCSAVRRRGGGCLAYSASRPLPGALDSGVRIASR